jgi:hypothetical protein
MNIYIYIPERKEKITEEIKPTVNKYIDHTKTQQRQQQHTRGRSRR